MDVLWALLLLLTPPSSPVVTSVSPPFGQPSGGQIVTITGINFNAPVRVFFDQREAFVVQTTPNMIQVVTPPVDLGEAQKRDATITVTTSAGTPNEGRVTAAQKFRYEKAVLKPAIVTASPQTGPFAGGTRVTIFGEGFQAPVQVFFGTVEAQVIAVQYDQIVVVSPPMADRTPVDVTVRNYNSGTEAVAPGVFRYVAGLTITNVTPLHGSSAGGTRVTIDGSNFEAPVVVVIAGVMATPLRVSNNQIVVVTNPASDCRASGPVVVTNGDNGDNGSAFTFTYDQDKPLVRTIDPPGARRGAPVRITVNEAGAVTPRIVIGGHIAPVLSTQRNANGTTTFTVNVPTTIVFRYQACTHRGETGRRALPMAVDVEYTNLATACRDVARAALTVVPDDPRCVDEP